MAEKMIVSTRKGLFNLSRNGKGWEIGNVDFLGDNVTVALTDPRSGYSYSTMAISASSCTATTAMAGKRSQRRPIPKNPRTLFPRMAGARTCPGPWC
jgi:hypothetical protein